MQEEDHELQHFVSCMPKVELHAHLNGCIREDTLFDLAREKNVQLSTNHFGHHHQHQKSSSSAGDNNKNNDYCNSLSYMYNVKPRSLKDCFEMFDDLKLVINDQKSLQRITKEALEDFAYHHVVYLELRSTPKRFHDLTKKQYIETIIQVMKDFHQKQEQEERYFHHHQKEERPPCADDVGAAANNNNNNNNIGNSSGTDNTTSPFSSSVRRLPMRCRFLVSIDRSASIEEAEENVALAIDFYNNQNNEQEKEQGESLVVGVDIGGNPTKNDFRDFQPILAKARKAGLKVTVHCAEVPVGEETDTDHHLRKAYEEACAVFEFRPDRLGHALLLPASLRDKFMIDDDGNEDKKKIPVECCPTSNVMTLELAKHVGGNLIHGLQQHPQLKPWLDNKYPLSIATDDPGVFNTNATQELLLLARAWSVSKEGLKQITINSIDHAFCSDVLKDSVKKIIDGYYLDNPLP